MFFHSKQEYMDVVAANQIIWRTSALFSRLESTVDQTMIYLQGMYGAVLQQVVILTHMQVNFTIFLYAILEP